jgi:hypothetical protein
VNWRPLPESLTIALQQEAQAALAKEPFNALDGEITVEPMKEGTEGLKSLGLSSRLIAKDGFTAEDAREAIQQVIQAAVDAVRNQDSKELAMAGIPLVREVDSHVILLDQPPVWLEDIQDWTHDGKTVHFNITLQCRWTAAP